MNNNNIKYKNTNNDFVPQIPEHWEFLKMRHIGDLYSGLAGKSGKDFQIETSKYRYIPFTSISNDIRVNLDKLALVKMSEGEIQNQVNKDDILFLMSSETQEDIGKCAIVQEQIDNLFLNSFCKGFRISNEEVYANFLIYALNSLNYRNHFMIEGKGFTRINLKQFSIKNLAIALPPHDEQVAIANYLDKKCEQINQFILDKKQLINLLKEQRQSVINSHVNRTENDDSNDWVSNKLKHISDIKFSNVDKLTHKGEVKVRLCNYVDVYKNDYITNKIDFMLATATLEEIEKFKVLKGDIIITKDSESANDIGIPAFVSEDIENLVCAYHLAMIRANQEIIIDEFLFRKIESKEVNSQFEVNATGVTRVGLSIADISNVLISYPKDINVQKEIIAKIKSETKTIDETIFKTEEELRLVAEYKEALISNAVTGQLSIA